MNPHCPNCETPVETSNFYAQADVPVHSCVLLDTRAQALEFPRGDLKLMCCGACGFIWNVAFEPRRMQYGVGNYEETQAFSPRYREFQSAIIGSLIKRYNLRHKRVVEIGCGKGEFLIELCKRGENSGIGFDPSFVPERADTAALSNVSFVRDYYSADHAHIPADFVCCRMTLEHVHDPLRFLRMIRAALAEQPAAIVHVQVPNTLHALDEGAFWDFYYEHCSYFTAGSLGTAFRRAGFEVLDASRMYDGQYLLIAARPARQAPGEPQRDEPHRAEESYSVLENAIASFTHRVSELRGTWNGVINDSVSKGRRVAIWGSGSKTVAFLGTLENPCAIDQVVDINPHRHHRFMPGTGHRIDAPEALRQSPPDLVIVMNAVYRDEITSDLKRLGVHAEVASL